jgi:hypothetical protein
MSLVVCAGLLFGCQAGQDGEPGPQGTAGAAGTKGPQGLPGTNGTPIIKQGSLTATLTGLRANGTPFEESINYQYTSAGGLASFTQRNGVNEISIYQQDSLGLGHLSLYFETDANFANPRFIIGDLESNKTVTNNQYDFTYADFYLYVRNKTYTSNVIANTISNVVYDATTGRLTGNIDWQVDNSNYYDSGTIGTKDYVVSLNNTSGSRQPLRIKGTFSTFVKHRAFRVKAGQ